jgi:predicted GIY-YIG superfamily endonuclease
MTDSGEELSEEEYAARLAAGEPMPGEGRYVVYVLSLEDGCYYVGKAKGDGDSRIRSHFRGRGAEWTKEHKPVEVDLKESVETNEVAKSREKELTDEYIGEYGEDKVRGAGYTGVGGSQ